MKQRVMCYVCNFCQAKEFDDTEGAEHPPEWFAMNIKNDEKGARPMRKHVCGECANEHSLTAIKEKLCEDKQTMFIL